jgi:hypothetical protein
LGQEETTDYHIYADRILVDIATVFVKSKLAKLLGSVIDKFLVAQTQFSSDV